MSSAGEKTITVTYTEGGVTKTETYTITVNGGGQQQTYIYEKITSTSELVDGGQYLIVYEDGNLAFDGGLTTLDAVGNTIAVTITNNTIPSNATTDAASFIIDTTNNTIQSASGYYIGQTSNANGLASNQNTTYANAISFNDDGTVNIVSGGAYLRYNSTSNQVRFRYYKSSSYTGQKAIALYVRKAV